MDEELRNVLEGWHKRQNIQDYPSAKPLDMH